MDNLDIKSLKKRYLVWLYKFTREELDKTDRKFTQLEVDQCLLEELKKLDKAKAFKSYTDEFSAYMHNKQKEALSIKYEGGKIKPRFQFLALKLEAIERAIVKELGKPALKEIKAMYEEEMLKRIIQEKQHKL